MPPGHLPLLPALGLPACLPACHTCGCLGAACQDTVHTCCLPAYACLPACLHLPGLPGSIRFVLHRGGGYGSCLPFRSTTTCLQVGHRSGYVLPAGILPLLWVGGGGCLPLQIWILLCHAAAVSWEEPFYLPATWNFCIPFLDPACILGISACLLPVSACRFCCHRMEDAWVRFYHLHSWAATTWRLEGWAATTRPPQVLPAPGLGGCSPFWRLHLPACSGVLGWEGFWVIPLPAVGYRAVLGYLPGFCSACAITDLHFYSGRYRVGTQVPACRSACCVLPSPACLLPASAWITTCLPAWSIGYHLPACCCRFRQGLRSACACHLPAGSTWVWISLDFCTVLPAVLRSLVYLGLFCIYLLPANSVLPGRTWVCLPACRVLRVPACLAPAACLLLPATGFTTGTDCHCLLGLRFCRLPLDAPYRPACLRSACWFSAAFCLDYGTLPAAVYRLPAAEPAWTGPAVLPGITCLFYMGRRLGLPGSLPGCLPDCRNLPWCLRVL